MTVSPENHEYQCSRPGCGNRTMKSSPGFCETHSSNPFVVETTQGKILFAIPGCGDQFGVTAFRFGDANEEVVDQFCSSGSLSIKWETAPETISACTYDEHGPPIEFGNVEAAVQALRVMDENGNDFKNLSGNSAVLLARRLSCTLMDEPDDTYGS